MTDNAREFRNALGQFLTGVTVVTARDKDGNRIGMTANSFSSVSLDPMLVLWSIAKSASAFDAFEHVTQYAIHVLGEEQQAVSNQFAAKEGDRFAGIALEENGDGVPLLRDYAARFECDIDARHEGGDHIILVGRVTDFDYKPAKPLAFHAGKYVAVKSIES